MITLLACSRVDKLAEHIVAFLNAAWDSDKADSTELLAPSLRIARCTAPCCLRWLRAAGKHTLGSSSLLSSAVTIVSTVIAVAYPGCCHDVCF